MNIVLDGRNKNIAVIRSEKILIADLQSALDIAMTVNYTEGVSNLVIPKCCITNDFFVLSTRLAGDILQKYINYGIKLAIWGDYSSYTSKSLHDFIYESNNGKDFYFVLSETEAVEKLEKVCT